MKQILSWFVVFFSIFVSPALRAELTSWTWPAAGIGILAGGLGAGLGTYYAQVGCSGPDKSDCEGLRAGIATGIGVTGALVCGGIGAFIGHAISSKHNTAFYPVMDIEKQHAIGLRMSHEF